MYINFNKYMLNDYRQLITLKTFVRSLFITLQYLEKYLIILSNLRGGKNHSSNR